MTKNVTSRIIRMFSKDLMTIQQIADNTNLPVRQVRAIIEPTIGGMSFREARAFYRREGDFVEKGCLLKKTDAVKLYKEGNSVETIASQYHTTVPIVRAAVRSAGLHYPRQHFEDKKTQSATCIQGTSLPKEEAIRLYTQCGWSAWRIGSTYGTTGITVVRYLRCWGVKTRNKKEAHGEWKKAVNDEDNRGNIGKNRTMEDRRRMAEGAAGVMRSWREVVVLEHLRSMGLEPVPAHVIHRFTVDLAFVEQKLAIEVWSPTSQYSLVSIRCMNNKWPCIKSKGWSILNVRVNKKGDIINKSLFDKTVQELLFRKNKTAVNITVQSYKLPPESAARQKAGIRAYRAAQK